MSRGVDQRFNQRRVVDRRSISPEGNYMYTDGTMSVHKVNGEWDQHHWADSVYSPEEEQEMANINNQNQLVPALLNSMPGLDLLKKKTKEND